MKCKKCDLCRAAREVKNCKTPFLYADKKVYCLCIDCIKKIDAHYNDFVIVYNGIYCFVTRKGKKFLTLIS